MDRLDEEFCAPDIIMSELGNILWKKIRREDITAARANAVAETISDPSRFPVTLLPVQDLVPAALRIATEFDRSFYDALYLAAALELDAQFVTADLRLVNAISTSAEWRERVKALSAY